MMNVSMADNLPVQPSSLGSPSPAVRPSVPSSSMPSRVASVGSGPQASTIAIVVVIGLIIMGVVGYLFWQGRQFPDQLPSLPQTTETAEVAENGFSASPVPSPVAQTGVVSEKLTYTLPSGWLENPAEGQLTPEIAFLNRLRSGDACNTVVTALFITGTRSFNDFILSQYPGNTLASLQHNVQFSVSGKETFTVRPQGVGESFTLFVKGNGVVHGVFASYLPVPSEQEGVICSPEPPALFELAQSLAVQ